MKTLEYESLPVVEFDVIEFTKDGREAIIKHEGELKWFVVTNSFRSAVHSLMRSTHAASVDSLESIRCIGTLYSVQKFKQRRWELFANLRSSS